uniref:Putative ovule protein n=1 Tax=Solanum chacoense TaxID=4108 RepID=A0A0V0H4L4_SOLCH
MQHAFPLFLFLSYVGCLLLNYHGVIYSYFVHVQPLFLLFYSVIAFLEYHAFEQSTITSLFTFQSYPRSVPLAF